MSGDVEVHLYAAARAAVGLPVVDAPAGTLAALLDDLTARFPEFGPVRPRCSFLVDGLAAHGDVDVPPGARVDVLPPFAGG